MAGRGKTGFLRARGGHSHARVTNIELFFDLVFVFAITQLSHTLLHHLSIGGALQTGLLFLAVWWVWIYTSWVTNWLDPERGLVRLALLLLMLAGLALSTSLPKAFAEKGLAFASAYVFMQVGRSLFMVWTLRGHSPGNARNFQRITLWSAAAGVLWIVGALLEGESRFGLWAAALAIEYAGPSLGFFVPGLGASTTADWDVEGEHLAERCGLFIIIALGESVLVTGATMADLAWDATTLTAFAVAFVGSAAMWWIYFDTGAERGSRLIGESEDPGRIARLAYTYLHLLIVAGIIVAAVSDELLLAHPHGHVEASTTAAMLGGPALFVAGNMLFKWVVAGRCPLSHLGGLVLFAVLVPLAHDLTPLLLAAGAALVLVVVAGWEWASLRHHRANVPVRSHT
ncbi:low temperature requirement protein A [Methylobacterium sp. sgz302541]|uniref:low temperature requirement protein A n=1 Tax=unclassified Methylobacterium TaxID=2615210 RepID=UPI003D33E8F7